MFPLCAILIGRTQPEKVEVCKSTTQCLDSIGRSIDDYILVCLRIVIPRITAIAKDIIA
jgi:hypothetical protein